ncbi:glycosyltransferase [Chloroflexota bacterium]
MPYIDLYAKCDLLRDRSLYTKKFYGERIFTDYYHQSRGIIDNVSPSFRQPIKPEELPKLALSWNLGLGDYRTFDKWGLRARMFLPWASYDIKPVSPCAERDIDIFLRGRTRYKHATVSFQREETIRQLESFVQNNSYRALYGGVVRYNQYKKERSRSRIMVSPFGIGEVCYRDFECFMAGALLFKPDMSHLETWPNYYVPEITYIPFAWDFSDFQVKLREVLDSPEKCKKIAQKGQDIYLNSLSPTGGEAFAQHFAELLQKAVENSRNN